MEPDAVERFSDGFPATWKRLLRQSFSPDILNESDKQVKPRRSSRNREKMKPQSVQRDDIGPSLQEKVGPGMRKEARSENQEPSRRSLGNKPSTDVPVKPIRRKQKKSSVQTQRPATGSLAVKLKSAQEAKKARRARRVAFADVPEKRSEAASPPQSRTPGLKRPSRPPLTPLKNVQASGWSEAQRKAFDRQRNSVSADDVDYWESIASGVTGKTAQECRELWELSWASPRAKEAKGNAMKDATAEETVQGLRKALMSKRGRNTAKFRSQTRHLVELVAAGTGDAALEPSVPGAAIARNISVTPRLQGIGTVSRGTPGTEIRRKREQNERAGTVATPELLSRGRKVGFSEADQYVSLFKRRLDAGGGNGKAQGSTKQAVVDSTSPLLKNPSNRVSDEEWRAVRRSSENESDYSDESSIFF